MFVDDDGNLRERGREQWLDQPGDAPDGFLRYRDDSPCLWTSDLPDDETNHDLVDGTVTGTLLNSTTDMTGIRIDADPSTISRWENGSWAGYEDTAGRGDSDSGGFDTTIQLQITSDPLGDPFVVEAGTSSAWYDTDRNGEGFMLEILAEIAP